METGISSVLFLFERLKCHNNRAGGPNWVLSYDPYGPARYFIRKRKKKIRFRAGKTRRKTGNAHTPQNRCHLEFPT